MIPSQKTQVREACYAFSLTYPNLMSMSAYQIKIGETVEDSTIRLLEKTRKSQKSLCVRPRYPEKHYLIAS